MTSILEILEEEQCPGSKESPGDAESPGGEKTRGLEGLEDQMEKVDLAENGAMATARKGFLPSIQILFQL